jgi:ABC-type cobalamin/Fe3+-siderophores transport system ATPase subunit
MLVGATGSGKSTLIDGIINYITDVSLHPVCRYRYKQMIFNENVFLKTAMCSLSNSFGNE